MLHSFVDSLAPPRLLRRSWLTLCAVIGGVLDFAVSHAQVIAPDENQHARRSTAKVIHLETLQVTAALDSYHEVSSSMASKTPMELQSLPSSLSIMNAASIADRNPVSLVDVFGYVVGATQSQGNINGFSFRGFPSTGSYTQNIQFDGLMGATLKKAATSAANVDRLEFLKGPNGVLYGQMNPGGLLNIVTKNPKEVAETRLRFTAGTFAGEFNDPGNKNTFSGTVDATGPLGLNRKLFYRLVIDTGSTPGSRPGFDHTYSIYPSLTYKWSSDTSLTIKGETSKDTRRQDDGLLPIFSTPSAFGESAAFYTAPLNTVYQDSADRGLDFGHAIAGSFRTVLASDWTLSLQTRSVWHADEVREFTINNANIYAPASTFARPTSLLRRQYNHVLNGHRYNHGDANVYRSFGPEHFSHTLLFGAGGGAEAFHNRRLAFGPNQPLAQAVTLIDPILDQAAAYPADGTGATDVATYWTSRGEYFSDQIKFGRLANLSVGLRHDLVKIHGGNKLNLATTRFNNEYETYTRQLGLVGHLNSNLAAYVGWNQSIKPGSNLAFDAAGNSSFPAETGEQVEGGFKFENPAKTLNVTLAAYQITRTNVIVPSGTNFSVATGNALPGQPISRLDGEQRSRGGELELRWQPRPHWQIQSGIAYSKATITQSTRNPSSVGSDLANAPRLSGNVWTRYNIPFGRLKGIGFGGGLVHVGRAWAGDPTTTVYYRLKAWARVDGSLYYQWKNYDISLNVQNLLDRRYISAAQTALTLNVGEQRKLTLSVGMRL